MSDLSPAADAIIFASWADAPAGMRSPYAVRCGQVAAAFKELAKRINGADEIKADVLDIAAELDAEAARVEAGE